MRRSSATIQLGMEASPPKLVGRDVPAVNGMWVKLAAGVDDFVSWVPAGMVGRITTVWNQAGEAVVVQWPEIRRDRVCRTGARGCFDLEFVGWGGRDVSLLQGERIGTHGLAACAVTGRKSGKVPTGRPRSLSVLGMKERPGGVPCVDQSLPSRAASSLEGGIGGEKLSQADSLSMSASSPSLRVKEKGRISRRMWGTCQWGFQDPIILPHWLRSETTSLASSSAPTPFSLSSHSPKGAVAVGTNGGGQRSWQLDGSDQRSRRNGCQPQRTAVLDELRRDFLSAPTATAIKPMHMSSQVSCGDNMGVWRDVDGSAVHPRAGHEMMVHAFPKRGQNGNRRNKSSPRKKLNKPRPRASPQPPPYSASFQAN